MSTSNYSNSPSRSPIVCPRLQLGAGGASRLRSSSLKKPPEPLRRAVADCLSPSSHHGSPAAVASDASRTLRVGAISSFSQFRFFNFILQILGLFSPFLMVQCRSLGFTGIYCLNAVRYFRVLLMCFQCLKSDPSENWLMLHCQLSVIWPTL